MDIRINNLIVDIQDIERKAFLDAWEWCINGMEVFIISKIGDMFLIGQDKAIYWLAIDRGGVLTKIANDKIDFEQLLNNTDNLDNWFLPGLVEQFIAAGIRLGKNEVYSFKLLPVLGGEYSINNIESCDINVHFDLAGQICKQIKDLHDGTKVKIVVKD